MTDLLSRAQQQLHPVEGAPFRTFASSGHAARAGEVAARADRAWGWLETITPPRHARPPLLVLAQRDWAAFAPMPVYGMPQAWVDRLVVGTSSEGLWSQYLSELDGLLSDDATHELRAAYGDPPNLGDLFADLLVAHEVGHYFHAFTDDGTTDLARPWVAELFANVALYGYLAEREPEHLRTLEVVCEVSASPAATPWSASSVAQMGGGTASGYVWFQLLLILVARQLWATAGRSALPWFRSAVSDAWATDEDLLAAFAALSPEAGAALRDWPRVQRGGGLS